MPICATSKAIAWVAREKVSIAGDPRGIIYTSSLASELKDRKWQMSSGRWVKRFVPAQWPHTSCVFLGKSLALSGERRKFKSMPLLNILSMGCSTKIKREWPLGSGRGEFKFWLCLT